jgi:hypothetical protein
MLFALFARGPANRLDGLDLEWLDDGLEWHHESPFPICSGRLQAGTLAGGLKAAST